jgi:hypothetical protein
MRLLALVFVCLFSVVSSASAQQERQVWVRVEDPSGATIPGALIIVLSGSDVISELAADNKGLALVSLGTAKEIKLIVSAEGFATTEQDVTISARPPQQITVSLPLAKLEADVSVLASQEESGGLTQTLSQAEIDQLPDDPEELQRMLEEIAGPGAVIRVDGFSGGRLPPRDQIARIVVRRDAYSAEFHQIGQGRVEIATRPGVDRWRGNAGLNVRPSALSAHNAVARTSKGGTLTRANAFIAGPLVRNRISFATEVSGSSSEDTRGISALTPSGPFVAALKQPSDNHEVTFRTEGLLTRTTLFRASVERGSSKRDNQGISELDMPERGYRRQAVDYSARLSLEGGQRRPFHVRVQYDQSRSESIPDTIAPAIIVQSAFRSGGASVSGANRSRAVVNDNMFTLRTRPYTWRIGSLMNWNYSEQGQLQNALGTFTFTDLESYTAGRPTTFTQRVGAQPLAFWVGQGAAFTQFEFTTRARWSFGLGLRYEWQTGIDDRGALAPRLGVTRQFRRGQTNLRAGYGWFYGWMPTRIEEESIRLAQGSTEQEIIIRDPGYPDAYGQGIASTRRDPPTRLLLADTAELPRFQRLSLGIDHQIRQGWRVGFDSFYERARNEFRAVDINAPVDGVRPNVAFGRMLLVQSMGRSTEAGVNVNLSLTPRRGMFGNVRYGYSRTMNDADDALTPPATGTFETEWAIARGDSPHRFNWNIGGQIGPPSWGLNGSINGRLNSGSAYNVTTGRDENRDAIFNDRPAGERRNSRRGDMTAQTDLRVSWIISGRPINAQLPFFPSPPSVSSVSSVAAGSSVSSVAAQRGPGGGQGPRGPGGPGRGPGGPGRDQGKRLEMYLSVQNLLNRVNYSSYVGVLTSPLFGLPTSAQAARRLELGWRFSF